MADVLGVNGSPRKYGNTYKSLRIALMAAEYEDLETELINLVDLDIKPCLGCLCDEQKACKYPCVIDDDMRELYDKILEAKGVIIATPIYWFSPSGLTKNFLDRLTALENMIFVEGKSWLEGKIGGVIAIGNDGGGLNVVSTIVSALNCMGFLIPPFAITYFEEQRNVMDSLEFLTELANIGRNLALVIKKETKKRWFDQSLKEWIKEVREKIEQEARRIREQEKERMKIVTKLIEKKQLVR